MPTLAPAIDANAREALAPTDGAAPTVTLGSCKAQKRLRRILVHIDDASSAVLRLVSARTLAGVFDAGLLACYCTTPSAKLHALEVGLTLRGIDRCDEEDYARGRAAYDAFAQTCERLSDVDWLDLCGEPEQAFEREALYADYLVLQRPDRLNHVAGVSASFVDHVLVRSGRPAVVLPPRGVLRQMPRTVAIAWTESPAAARALASAMPLLREARNVHIIGCGEGAYSSVAGLAARLEAQGSVPRSHILEDAGSDLGIPLLNCAARLGADLLVMGCFGHSQTRERVLGGASRTALDRAPMPLLVAH